MEERDEQLRKLSHTMWNCPCPIVWRPHIGRSINAPRATCGGLLYLSFQLWGLSFKNPDESGLLPFSEGCLFLDRRLLNGFLLFRKRLLLHPHLLLW